MSSDTDIIDKKNKGAVVVVGGGLVGLVAAIIKAEREENVILLEKSSKTGGLLSSYEDEMGNYFDIGTHIPCLTNTKSLDELLFGQSFLENGDWKIHDALFAGSYFNGKWNLSNGLLDTRALPEDKYVEGLRDFFSCENFEKEVDLESYLLSGYGKTFTDQIFRKVIGKLTDKPLNSLDPALLKLFSLNRIIMLTRQVSEQLKRIPFFDDRVGHHDAQKVTHLYPTHKSGCSRWISRLTEKAIQNGVQIEYETGVKQINLNAKQAISVLCDNNKLIPTNEIIWTAPTALAYMALNEVPANKRPELLTTVLTHQLVQGELLIEEPLYLWVFDPQYSVFRITLYPNITGEPRKGLFRITSESFVNNEVVNDVRDVFQQLKKLGVIAKSSTLKQESRQILPNTFPVMHKNFQSDVMKNAIALQDRVRNLKIYGRNSGKTWFMTDSLIELWNDLAK